MQINDRRIFFINCDGEEIPNKEKFLDDEEEINCHDGLASWIVENDETLKQRFQKSGIKLEIAFLLKEGWAYGTECERYKEIVCLPENISSKEGIKLIQHYREEGYKVYDMKKLYGEETLKEFLGEEQERQEEEENEI